MVSSILFPLDMYFPIMSKNFYLNYYTYKVSMNTDSSQKTALFLHFIENTILKSKYMYYLAGEITINLLNKEVLKADSLNKIF